MFILLLSFYQPSIIQFLDNQINQSSAGDVAKFLQKYATGNKQGVGAAAESSNRGLR